MATLTIRIVLAVALTHCLLSSLMAEEVKAIKLASQFSDFAVDPETGNVAAIDPKASTIELFRAAFLDGDAKAKAAPLKVGNLPSAIVYKKFKQRGVFVVACFNDSHIFLIDAAEFTVLRKIPMQQLGIAELACSSDSADPYVYYCFQAEHDRNLGRINLTKLGDEGTVARDINGITVSARGELYYILNRFRGAQVARKTETNDKPVLEVTRYVSERSSEENQTIVPDVREVMVASDEDIYTADMSKRLTRLGFRAKMFYPDRPLIFGIKDQDLCVASCNTFQTLATQSLPWPRRDRRSDDDEDRDFGQPQALYEDGRLVGRYQVRVLPDVKGKRVVVGAGDQLFVVSLNGLKLPEEPFMQVRLNGPTDLTADKETKLSIAKADPRLVVSLLDPPEGTAIEKDTIVIKPSADQIGEFNLQLSVKHGSLEVVQVVPLRISQPNAKLPFAPTLLAIDPAGKKAVCGYCNTAEVNAEGRRTTRLAIVDLATMKTERAFTLPIMATAIATDGVHAFIADANDMSIQIIPLAEGKARRLSVNDQISSLFVVPGKLLHAITFQGKQRQFTWKDTSWIERTQKQPNEWQIERRRFHETPRSLAGGWFIDGMLYDQELSRVRLIHRPTEITLMGREYNFHDDDNRQPTAPLSAWSHPQMQAQRGFDGLVGHGDVAEKELELFPALVSVNLSTGDHDGREEGALPQATLQLSLRDLLQGGDRQQIVLAQGTLQDRDRRGMDQFQHQLFKLVGSIAYVAWEDRLFAYDLSSIDAKRYPRTLSISLDQSALVVDLKQKTKLTHKISLPKGKWSARLEGKETYASIDPATADVTIDGPALVADIQRALIKDTEDEEGGPRITDWRYIQEGLSLMKELGSVEFERITGKKPTGLPYAIPIHLRVSTSDSGDDASLDYYVLADVPDTEVQKRLAEAQQKAKAEMAKQRERADALTPEGQARRLTQLEDRMKAIKTKLDRITELLSKEK